MTVPQLEEVHLSLVEVDKVINPSLCLLTNPVRVRFQVFLLLKFWTDQQFNITEDQPHLLLPAKKERVSTMQDPSL